MRICKTCKRELPEDRFYYFSRGVYALLCKPCYLARNEIYRKRYLTKHRERELERKRQWVKENPTKHARGVKRYRLAYPDRVRAQTNIRKHRRRVREAGVGGSHTLMEWQLKVIEYANCCAYCGVLLDKPEKDHIIPISKSGSNSIENIVPSCLHCNRSKHDSIWVVGRTGELADCCGSHQAKGFAQPIISTA